MNNEKKDERKLSKKEKMLYKNIKALPKLFKTATKTKKKILQLLIKEYLDKNPKLFPTFQGAESQLQVLGTANNPIDLTLDEDNISETSFETLLQRLTNFLGRQLSNIELVAAQIQYLFFYRLQDDRQFIITMGTAVLGTMYHGVLYRRETAHLSPESEFIFYLIITLMLFILTQVIRIGVTFVTGLLLPQNYYLQQVSEEDDDFVRQRKTPKFYVDIENSEIQMKIIEDPITFETIFDPKNKETFETCCWLKCGHIVEKDNFILWASTRERGNLFPFFQCPICRAHAAPDTMSGMCIEIANREKLQQLLQMIIDQPFVSADALKQTVLRLKLKLKF